MSEVYGWDCECGAGVQLTAEEAAKGCPVEYPERCGLELSPRAVRVCRLGEDECARRCAGKPGGCDTYGEGLASDGLINTGCSREIIEEGGVVHVELSFRTRAPCDCPTVEVDGESAPWHAVFDECKGATPWP